MAKATTIKEAIKRFEDMKTVTAAEQDKVLAARVCICGRVTAVE